MLYISSDSLNTSDDDRAQDDCSSILPEWTDPDGVPLEDELCDAMERARMEIRRQDLSAEQEEERGGDMAEGPNITHTPPHV